MFHLLNKYLKEFKNIFAQDYRNISPGKEPFIYETLLVSDKVTLLLGYLLAPEFPLISCGCLTQGFNQCYQFHLSFVPWLSCKSQRRKKQ